MMMCDCDYCYEKMISSEWAQLVAPFVVLILCYGVADVLDEAKLIVQHLLLPPSRGESVTRDWMHDVHPSTHPLGSTWSLSTLIQISFYLHASITVVEVQRYQIDLHHVFFLT